MGNIIAMAVIVLILFISIKPIIKYNKNKGDEPSCFKCSQSGNSECGGCCSTKDKQKNK